VAKRQRRNPSIRSLASIEETLEAFFSEESEVVLAYLFGSFLGRRKGAFHDIDIAVFVAPNEMEALDRGMRYGYRASLSAKLSHILRYDPIDLVILNNAPPLLLRQVIGKGKLIFSRSEADQSHFEVASLKRYADTAHIRQIKRFYMNQRIEKGLTAYA
jgi:predicted nucleotidyltransferase